MESADIYLNYSNISNSIESRVSSNLIKYNYSKYNFHYYNKLKFSNDSFFYNDDDIVIAIYGVVLNKVTLVEKYKLSNFQQTIKHLFYQFGQSFIKYIEGSFIACILDKKSNSLFLFSDLVGSKQLFYYLFNNNLIISDSLKTIVDKLNEKRLPVVLDLIGSYYMLTYGFMLENKTLVSGIKKLIPGSCIYYHNNILEINEVIRISNKEVNISLKDAIENIDYLFRKSVKLQFDKDLEYGFNHIANLSGGLDSRMTVFVSHDLGYMSQLNLTFSESDYLDETIPKQIARNLKHDWIFKSLDNGEFLKYIDTITQITEGNVICYGSMHQESIYKNINFDNYGILHTGQLGDVIIGTFFKDLNNNKQFTLGDGAYSTKLIHKITNFQLENNYLNQEIFNFYNRGFNGANYGLRIIQNYTETFSPFYNTEFLNFCLSLPIEFRLNHSIYFDWIKTKYPAAANYIWERIGCKIDSPFIVINNKKYYYHKLKFIPSRLWSKINKKNNFTRQNMNPLNYWYNNNNSLKTYWDDYFIKYNDIIKDNELREDLSWLYNNGNAFEKNQVLSLLSAIKYLNII